MIFSLTLETLGVELRCTSPALRVIIITLVMGNLLALMIIACNVCDFNNVVMVMMVIMQVETRRQGFW